MVHAEIAVLIRDPKGNKVLINIVHQISVVIDKCYSKMVLVNNANHTLGLSMMGKVAKVTYAILCKSWRKMENVKIVLSIHVLKRMVKLVKQIPVKKIK